MQKYIFLFLIICSMDLFPQEVGSGNNLEFTGNSSRVVYGNIYDALDLPLTIATWVYLPESSTSNRQVFFASCWPDNKIYSGVWTSIGHDSFGVSYGDGNGALMPQYRRTKSVNLTNDISGTWVHVAFVISGPLDMNLYLNGVELGGSYSGSGDAEMYNAIDGRAQIGFISNNNGDNFFHGELDELQFWNYALSEEEIRSNMCKKLDGDESGLIGYWNFDEGSGANTEELVSGNMGTIEGVVNWQTSGAPIGDESYFKYFLPGKKKGFFENNAEDSFWISVASDAWEGYQVYKVNEVPNSVQGSSVDFNDGYYGIFPVFTDGVENMYKVDVLKSGCDNDVEFRNGNDDPIWEPAIQDSDSSAFYESMGITELNFETGGNLNPINNAYMICPNEPIDINAESGCAIRYLWSDGSSNPIATFNQPGSYWVERETNSGVTRENFTITEFDYELNLFSSEEVVLCQTDFPYELTTQLEGDFVWNTGENGNAIQIIQEGYYWVESITDCGVIRDSLYVEIVKLKDVFIPNVITPNDDGKNDCFIVDNQLIGSELVIINRAGVRVFFSENYTNNWCPSLPIGAYFYEIKDNCTADSYVGWLSILD